MSLGVSIYLILMFFYSCFQHSIHLAHDTTKSLHSILYITFVCDHLGSLSSNIFTLIYLLNLLVELITIFYKKKYQLI